MLFEVPLPQLPATVLDVAAVPTAPDQPPQPAGYGEPINHQLLHPLFHWLQVPQVVVPHPLAPPPPPLQPFHPAPVHPPPCQPSPHQVAVILLKTEFCHELPTAEPNTQAPQLPTVTVYAWGVTVSAELYWYHPAPHHPHPLPVLHHPQATTNTSTVAVINY